MGAGAIGRLAAFVRSVVVGVVSWALPPRCPGCGTPVAADHRFCAACWGGLHLLAPPWCAGCNRPFAFDRGDDARCAGCLADPPQHAGIRAAVAYGPVARRLALKLKYGRRIGIAATMAERMAPGMPPDLDLLVPVPLHRWRLWSRGYNQAALIAAALHRRTGVAYDPFTLVRRRPTVVLKGQGRRARRKAVAGAFVVIDRDPGRGIPIRGRAIRGNSIRGRAIGLVDDVYASGATAAACTRALLAAGATSVTVLCWARVVDDE